MNYNTSRFGSIEVAEKDIIHFPNGLYGFEQETEFVLLPCDPNIESPMEWLQSLKTPELAFVVTDPFLFMPDYKLVLTDEETSQLKINSSEFVSARVIVTVPDVVSKMTANFVAPVIVNTEVMLGKQVVLTSIEYDTRHFLLPQESNKSEEKVNR